MARDSENLIFAKVVGYIAATMADDDGETELPEGLDRLPAVLREITDAFENSGGFEFAADQALVLSHVFTVLEAAMRTLSEQAAGGGQDNAAAKIEWAANQAREMTAYLMEKHGSGDGGTLVLVGEDEGDDG
ncbi:MAG: hypothetical protein GY791_18970 [Alphaproteobacteria bacterium]|nr:hypothetical protein [Alphaproteobacteria bacterium]